MSPSPNTVSRVCAQCEVTILVTPLRSRYVRVFCGKACHRLWFSQNPEKRNHPPSTKSEVTCAECGHPMMRAPWQIKRHPTQLCSNACHARWRTHQQVGEANPNWVEKSSITCDACGAVLQRLPRSIAISRHHFCDPKCRTEWLITNRSGADSAKWIDRQLVTCAGCGCEILKTVEAVKRSALLFCGTRCAGDWKAKNWAGKNAPNWRGGSFPYRGPTWNSQKRAALERDKYICQHCGKGRTPDTGGVRLEVHHIVPFRQFGFVPGQNDADFQAHELDNLVTLCATCHRKSEPRLNGLQPTPPELAH